MINTDISNSIWNLKYRYNEETEDQFYSRLPVGLFQDLVDKDIAKYFPILGVNDRDELNDKFTTLFKQHKASLAGRALYSLGTDRSKQTLSNCFVVPIEKDSMVAIMEALKKASLTMQAGGGIGYNFSILRHKNSLIKTSGSKSSGVLSFMRIFDTTCGTIEAGGNRRGAQIAVLGVWHPDILEYIKCKRCEDNVPKEYRPYKNFNLSVFISDKFMEAVRKDADWDLVFPDTTYKFYDDVWDGNINKWLDLGYPIEVFDTIKAKDLWDLIMESNYAFAEPGVLFEDTININNTLWMTEYILACNPCGEQPLVENGSCNLGSLNLTQFVINAFEDNVTFDMESFNLAIKDMVVMLDRMLSVNYYPLKEQKDTVDRKRQIGLGITGLGDMLAMMRLKYSSKKALNFMDKLMSTMRITSYTVAVELAKELGAFPEWYDLTSEQKQQFVSGQYLKSLPEDLKKDILKYGVRCSRLLSIAPTGTMSLLLNNVSSGAEPIFLLEYNRIVKTSGDNEVTEAVRTYSWQLYVDMFGEEAEKPDYFETTDDLPVIAHINMQATLQKYVCTAISKTVNVPVDYPYEDFKEIYNKAHLLGIKGCTTYRPNTIIGSVISKKIPVCSDDNRPVGIIPNCAPKRKNELKCDIVHTSIKGELWIVLIGLLDGKPYEVFAGLTDELYLPKSCKEGIIRKQGKGKYELEVVIRRSPIIFKDLADLLMSNEEKALTRILSLNLRHGVLPKYVVEQLKKTNGAITTFSTAISRVLSRYVGIYTITGEDSNCPSCGEASLMMVEGCVKCSSPSCGYSRCN